jgi:hypothetical protein
VRREVGLASHVTVDRWQFTLTVMFHDLFPILTMGLALFGLVVLAGHGANFLAAPADPPLLGRAQGPHARSSGLRWSSPWRSPSRPTACDTR